MGSFFTHEEIVRAQAKLDEIWAEACEAYTIDKAALSHMCDVVNRIQRHFAKKRGVPQVCAKDRRVLYELATLALRQVLCMMEMKSATEENHRSNS